MAAAPSSLGTQFSEELSCSICLELFTRPKMLLCGHTFCQDCLQDHASRRAPFQCPNCRQQVRLPRQGVAGLPDNRIVANMCERFQQQATLSEERREQPQSGNKCSFHPAEEVRQYCKQCQVLLCHECFEESHDEHPIMSYRTAIQQHRGPVEALITEGRGILETYCSFVRGLREEEKSLDDQKQEADSKIQEAYREACNQIYQMLTEEKDRLLSEVETNHRQNKEAVQRQRDAVLADVAELSSVCDGTEQDMDREVGQFLRHESRLADVVGKFKEKSEPIPLEIHPDVFQPTENFTCTLGKVTVPGATASSGATAAIGHHHGNPSHTVSSIQRLTFGEGGSEPGQFDDPVGVTVSEEGEIFVAEHGNWRIQVFTLQGTFVRQFPTVVSDEEEMFPTDVALDGEGNLWVVWYTDSADFAVQYNKQGRVLRTIDVQVTGWYRGVAVDTRRNHILITQTAGGWGNKHAEVLVFRPDGTLVRTVGQQQGMEYPQYITVDGEGNILVSDRGNNCVYVYREDGQFLFKFGGEESGVGRLKDPRGICTDRAGNIIVADSWNGRVEMFDKTGRFLKHIATDMTGPRAVAMAPQGQLGTFVRQFPTVVSGEQKMCPTDVAMDGEGNLWVVGHGEMRWPWIGSAEFAVQYNKQGRVLRKIDLQKTGWARGVAVDTRRNHILITQTTGDFLNPHGEVLVFRSDGTLVRTVGQQQGMKYPLYITVDGEGNILVSDSENHCVYVYNEDGQFLFKFGDEGSGEGQLVYPRGICTDRAGNIIVADTGNSRVEMFDKTGKFLKHITTDMTSPYAVAMTPQGQLVVTDTVDSTVTIFKQSDCV
ncbi:PREDICTED: tripartite motif-containing protein 3-like [Branchiostoma belcheri]|uniref:RING-type E3 ubiquitin transferase n=1 Tax=Branchiostoma belcheri TaxID=7741 RepID=A0A6P4YYG0_BRABE|nr:PREDICTED: tripartite motif-containing protein 3-like [Branchiostoma belcheri]